jgi:hypothetical protein
VEQKQEKHQDRPIMLLARVTPAEGKFDDAKKIFERLCAALKEQQDCEGVEVICCVPEQLAWMEHWKNKTSLNAFNSEHMAYSSFIADFFAVSKGVPTRLPFRKIL